VAKLAKRTRLKIWHFRNAVGSNPTIPIQEINMESHHIRSSMIERNSMEEFVVTLYDEDGNNVATYNFQNYKDAENCVKKWYEHD
jgi:ribosomal protein S24E